MNKFKTRLEHPVELDEARVRALMLGIANAIAFNKRTTHFEVVDALLRVLVSTTIGVHIDIATEVGEAFSWAEVDVELSTRMLIAERSTTLIKKLLPQMRAAMQRAEKEDDGKTPGKTG